MGFVWPTGGEHAASFDKKTNASHMPAGIGDWKENNFCGQLDSSQIFLAMFSSQRDSGLILVDLAVSLNVTDEEPIRLQDFGGGIWWALGWIETAHIMETETSLKHCTSCFWYSTWAIKASFGLLCKRYTVLSRGAKGSLLSLFLPVVA